MAFSSPFRAPGDSTTTLDNIGPHCFWGFSPAVNLQQSRAPGGGSGDSSGDGAAKATAGGADEDTPLNILVVCPGDARHLLKTIAERRRFSRRPLHFFVYDKPTEALARHLLLLQIATDWELPLRQRCNTLLEVFGNARVQLRTAQYIGSLGSSLIDLVCEGTGTDTGTSGAADAAEVELMASITLGGIAKVGELKYRIRDELEQIFKSWRRGPGADANASGSGTGKDAPPDFDVDAHRELRLRAMYGEKRWDHRKGQVDWTYHQELGRVLADPREERRTCRVIHKRQYWGWRESGVAFEFGDQQYVVPNLSLASFAEGSDRKRGAVARKGHWCDLIVSPYVSVGITTETPTKAARGLFEVLNWNSGTEQQRHNAAEIAVHNVLSWLYELEHGTRYRMAQEHEIYSGLGEEVKARAEAERRKREAAEKSFDPDPDAATATAGDAGEEEAKGDATPAAADESGGESLPSTGAAQPPLPPPQSAAAAAEAAATAEAEAEAEAEAMRRADTIVESLDGVSITLLGGAGVELHELYHKSKYRGFFHRAFFSSAAVHLLDKSNGAAQGRKGADLGNVLAPGAEVVVEAAKYIWPLKEENKVEFLRRVHGFAAERGWRGAGGAADGGKDPLDGVAGNKSWDTYVFHTPS